MKELTINKEMKELTIIFNAQITMIQMGDETMVADERTIAGRVKEMLGADDVLVNDLKIFVSKEDHEVNHIE